MSKPIPVFISYAHDDRALMLELVKHLSVPCRKGLIEIWEDGKILAGEDWHERINAKLNESQIVVLLVSSSFVASKYIWDVEVPSTYEREKIGKCVVVPVLLSPCYYDDNISERAMLPKDNSNDVVAVNDRAWDSVDHAFFGVVKEIMRLVNNLTKTTFEHNISRSNVFTLKDIWGTIPVKKVEKIVLLQMNREEEFVKRLLADFNNPGNQGRNLFYFLSGCETQCPDFLAIRLLHHCQEDFYGCCFTYYGFDDVYIHRLKIKSSPTLTWEYLWQSIQNQLPLEWAIEMDGQNSTWDNFERFAASSSQFMRCIKRFPILCRLTDNESKNTDDIGAHLDYIVRKFSSLPLDAHKFSFFFIIEISGLHHGYTQSENKLVQHLQKIRALQDITYEYEMPPHLKVIEVLNHVGENDVQSWFRDILDMTRAEKSPEVYFSLLKQALLTDMEEEAMHRYHEHRAFSMELLIRMQRHVYQHLYKH